jgi:acetaldehyde dehydrogenase
MFKIARTSQILEMAAFAGIDPSSEGLVRARRLGIAATDQGLRGLTQLPVWKEISIVFDATSAAGHKQHSDICLAAGKVMIDLTPAAIGPYVIPEVNGDQHLDAANVNMVTCGGQATIPIVAAVSQVAHVHYGEIVSSIASKSAGPGTRANIDEFTQTTALGIEKVGGAAKGKAIIILNPAEPPVMMRGTVYTFSSGGEEEAIEASIKAMVARVKTYVPGFRLKQEVQFERFGSNNPLVMPGRERLEGIKATTLLEVEGAAHYLPAYAGNLDIMTSAGLRTAEKIAARKLAQRAA